MRCNPQKCPKFTMLDQELSLAPYAHLTEKKWYPFAY